MFQVTPVGEKAEVVAAVVVTTVLDACHAMPVLVRLCTALQASESEQPKSG